MTFSSEAELNAAIKEYVDGLDPPPKRCGCGELEPTAEQQRHIDALTRRLDPAPVLLRIMKDVENRLAAMDDGPVDGTAALRDRLLRDPNEIIKFIMDPTAEYGLRVEAMTDTYRSGRNDVTRHGDLLLLFYATAPVAFRITAGLNGRVDRHVDLGLFELAAGAHAWAVHGRYVCPLIASQYHEINYTMLQGSSDDVQCIYAGVRTMTRRRLARDPGSFTGSGLRISCGMWSCDSTAPDYRIPCAEELTH